MKIDILPLPENRCAETEDSEYDYVRSEIVTYSLLLPDSTETISVNSGSHFSIELTKAEHIPVLAYIPGTNICAAGFFPDDYNDGCILLSWERGFLGSVVRQLYRNGLHIDILDLEMLQNRIISAGDGNPWSCDREQLITSMAYSGSLPSHIPQIQNISISKIITVAESDFIAAVLFPANPFAQILDFTLNTGNVPMGVSYYFDKEGNQYVFTIDHMKWQITCLTKGCDVSGYW